MAVARFSEMLYVLMLSGISIALSVAVDYFLAQLHVQQPERSELLSHGLIGFFALAVVIGPPIETFLFQQLPISLARRFRMPMGLQFAMGSIPFAALHFGSGILTGLAGGVVGGVIFTLAYLTFVSQSKAKAFVITATIHSLHNLVPFIMYSREVG